MERQTTVKEKEVIDTNLLTLDELKEKIGKAMLALTNLSTDIERLTVESDTKKECKKFNAKIRDQIYSVLSDLEYNEKSLDFIQPLKEREKLFKKRNELVAHIAPFVRNYFERLDKLLKQAVYEQNMEDVERLVIEKQKIKEVFPEIIV